MKITKKPTKKCKTLKKEATQKKEHLQYRCNMIGLAEAMKVYNPMLQLRQDVCNDAKTPFWSLLKTYMDGTLITSERKRKFDMDFIKIINCYNPTTQKFKFGRHKGHGISSNDKKHLAEAYEKTLKMKHMRAHKILLHSYTPTLFNHCYLQTLEPTSPREGEEPTTSGCTVLVLVSNQHILDMSSHKSSGDNRRMRKHDSNDHKMGHKHDPQSNQGYPSGKNQDSNLILKKMNQTKRTFHNRQSSKGKRHKMIAKKGKTTDNDEPDNISINEAQTEFDKLFTEEMIKLNATIQKHIIGMDTVITEELFDKFKKVSSIADKRYITFREMMVHTMDASNRECLILSQMIKMLNNEFEKLLQKVEINQKNNNALNTEMFKIQTKTNENNLKINIYLKQIASLEKKLQETQSKVAEMEPMLNVGEMEVERTPTITPIIPIAEHVQNNVNEGK
ncbi:hypothetical protein ACFX1T_003887 [Malus domestica]